LEFLEFYFDIKYFFILKRARKSDLLENGQVRERGQRISLTLRTVNPDRTCKCSWPELCDRNINYIYGGNELYYQTQ